MALVLPLLLVLLLGMIDFGKAVNYWIDETHLANEGARWAVVNRNPGEGTFSNPMSLQKYIQAQADTGELKSGRAGDDFAPAQDAMRVCIDFPTNGSTSTSGLVGDPVRVRVSVEYKWLNFITRQIGSAPSTTIVGSSTMRLEQSPTTYAAGCFPS
jgi:Flp pilus assembly protein TadG